MRLAVADALGSCSTDPAKLATFREVIFELAFAMEIFLSHTNPSEYRTSLDRKMSTSGCNLTTLCKAGWAGTAGRIRHPTKAAKGSRVLRQPFLFLVTWIDNQLCDYIQVTGGQQGTTGSTIYGLLPLALQCSESKVDSQAIAQPGR